MIKRITEFSLILILLCGVIFNFAGCESGTNESAELSGAKALGVIMFEKSNNSSLCTDAVTLVDEVNKTANIQVSDLVDVTGLVATFNSTGVTVSVDGTVQTTGTSSNDFTSPVVYKVTAEDGTTQDYTVTVTQVNLRLASLSLSDGTLSPAFDSATTEYTATVYSEDSVEVTCTKSSSDVTVIVEGEDSLSNGENIITVTVTNVTLDNMFGCTSEYKITVTKGEPYGTWTYDYYNTATDPATLLYATVTMSEGSFVRVSALPDGTMVFTMEGDLAVDLDAGTVAVTWTYFKLYEFGDGLYYEYDNDDSHPGAGNLGGYLSGIGMSDVATGIFSYTVDNHLVMSLDLNGDGDYDDNMGGEPEPKDQETTNP